MDSIMYVLRFLYVLFLFIVIIKVLMNIANHIGERVGFEEFFMHLLQLQKKKK